ncbi:probable purine permease 10 [Capsicum annuum]|nr:probable purine permease 10 [Capsicum annuum]
MSNAQNFVQYKWWIHISIYSIFVLSGQAIGTLLGKLYFNKGGNNIWLASLLQNIGFPILIPFLLLSSTNNNNNNFDNRVVRVSFHAPELNRRNTRPAFLVLVPLYVSLGLFLGGNCMLYSIGQFYLPATTYTLLCTSQLGFNAFFSFFLNKQKINYFILNSLVLLTISSSLLLFQKNEYDDTNNTNKITKRKYIIGFVCTLAASAGYGLMLSLTRLAFEKIFKTESLRLVVEIAMYESLVASIGNAVAVFASGGWRDLEQEMNEFELGKKSYVLNLVGTAICWQVFTVGSNGLIFMVSSLFCNVISIVGVPMAPVLCVVFLHEKVSGVKVVSVVLAMWGFLSYMYQHYQAEKRNGSMYEVSRFQTGSHEGPEASPGSVT